MKLPESKSGRMTVLFVIIAIVLSAWNVVFAAVRDEWTGLGVDLVINLFVIAFVGAFFIIPPRRAERAQRNN